MSIDNATGMNPAKSNDRRTGQDGTKDYKDPERRDGKPGIAKKLAAGLVLFALVSVLFAVYFYRVNARMNLIQMLENRAAQMKPLSDSVDDILNRSIDVVFDTYLRNIEKLKLAVSAFQEDMLEKADGKPVLYRDGAVIRVTEDAVERPDGFLSYLQMDPEGFNEESGSLDYVPYFNPDEDPDEESEEDPDKEPDEEEPDSIYLVYYEKIGDGLYYIEWESRRESIKKQDALFNMDESLAGIEKAFGTSILVFATASYSKNDNQHTMIYNSPGLPEHRIVEEYGITKDMFSKAAADFENITLEKLSEAYHQIEIDGVRYEMFLQKMDNSSIGGDLAIAHLIPYENTGSALLEQTALVVCAFVMIGVFLMIWAYSILVLVRDHSLSENQRKELAPDRIRRHGLSILAVGGIVILVATALFVALFRLYSTCSQVSNSLVTLKQRLEENTDQEAETKRIRIETYEEFANRISDILEDHPEYASRGLLQEMCDNIEADYIMLFDHNGNEITTNSPYVDVSLGRNPESATYDFRLLLKGVSPVSKQRVMDTLTRLESAMIGVSVRTNVQDTDEEPEYNALLVVISADKIYNKTALTTSDIMSTLVSGGLVSFSVDPETNLILDASDRSLIGKNALEMGLPEAALIDGYRDFFHLDGLPYYGECTQKDKILYYYAAEQSHIYKNVWNVVLKMVAAYLVLMGFLLFCLLFGYRKFFDAWAPDGTVLDENSREIMLSGGKKKRSVDPAFRWKPAVRKYGVRTPIHMAVWITEILLIIVIIVLGVRMAASRGSSSTSLISFILAGKWAKGFNLFAITNIVILLGEVLVTVMAVKIVLRLISNALGTKGETVCRLLLSLVNYAGAIYFIYFALYDLGFRPGTLLASLGLISFAISLGAKDLITDIIAGLSIVFEGDYQVGDIIDVGGYRGEVLEIGVRTTKLEGRGGNIKIIGNQDVKNVINMTRKNSWVAIEIGVSADKSLAEVEKELELILPAIGKSIPDIISGPKYKGVLSIGKGGVNNLSIIAECNEEDYYSVQRALNRQIRESFEEHGIPIA